MKAMNKVGKMLAKSIERQFIKVADSSSSKACSMFAYEPKSPMVLKAQKKAEK